MVIGVRNEVVEDGTVICGDRWDMDRFLEDVSEAAGVLLLG
jgi:hypothetical protein